MLLINWRIRGEFKKKGKRGVSGGTTRSLERPKVNLLKLHYGLCSKGVKSQVKPRVSEEKKRKMGEENNLGGIASLWGGKTSNGTEIKYSQSINIIILK